MAWLKKLFQSSYPYTFSKSMLDNPYFKNCIDNCSSLKTNLVVASYYFSCDPETAKYRGRIYCIDGKDKRFPPLTDSVLKCKLSFSAFVYGTSIFDVYTRKCDPIKFSNRPFIDDRTPEEKDNYSKLNKQSELHRQ